MSILTYRLSELATSRKIASDLRDGSEDLTIKPRDRMSSHGEAYYINRNRIEDKKMEVISAPVDSAAYYDEYDIEDLH